MLPLDIRVYEYFRFLKSVPPIIGAFHKFIFALGQGVFDHALGINEGYGTGNQLNLDESRVRARGVGIIDSK